MLSRRTFITATLAAALPGRTLALGLSAAPGLEAAFSALSGVREGREGLPTLHALFAPWCHETPKLYKETRETRDVLAVRWIPFSGGMQEGRQGTEMLLRNPDPALIPQILHSGRWTGAPLPTPLSDAQDSAIARDVEPLLIRDLGRGVATPTLVYRMRDDRVRVIPGWLDARQLREVAALAA